MPEPNEATVTITVFEVNDPPAVLLDTVCLNGVTVAEDSGAFTDPGHCVDMVSFGPTDENNQSFDAWVVSSNHPELFAKKPSITAVDGTFGRLAFTPAANANGTATVTVKGRDGAGTSDGGDDLSDPVKFKITITAVDDPTAVPTARRRRTNRRRSRPLEQPSAEPTDAGPSITATLAPSEGARPPLPARPRSNRRHRQRRAVGADPARDSAGRARARVRRSALRPEVARRSGELT